MWWLLFLSGLNDKCNFFLIVCLEHECDTPGCKTVCVIDGNMKNARQVCLCKHVGELHFQDLQGSVVVGKPLYLSKCYYYIFLNKIINFDLQNIKPTHHCPLFKIHLMNLLFITKFQIIFVIKEMSFDIMLVRGYLHFPEPQSMDYCNRPSTRNIKCTTYTIIQSPRYCARCDWLMPVIY